MWWSRTLLALMLLALGPSACGFRPMYGRGDAGQPSGLGQQMASIRVVAIEDRLGQQLRNRLVQRLNPTGEPSAPQYYLRVRVTSDESGVARDSTGQMNIGNLQLSAQFLLAGNEGDATSGDIAQRYTNSARSTVNFRYVGPRYATIAQERDAESRALDELAENIVGQVAARLSRQAGP